MDTNAAIYSLSKKDCEQTAEKLIKAMGFEGTRKAHQISFYHAGLEPEDRAHRHHEWSKGKIKLIIATVAFGMGINKPDVRYVIHHTIPQSVTHYYQVGLTCSLRLLLQASDHVAIFNVGMCRKQGEQGETATSRTASFITLSSTWYVQVGCGCWIGTVGWT
jgi:hypothetical protein